MTLKNDARFDEKPICCFKNDKNLVNFDPSTQKSKKIQLLLIPFVPFPFPNLWHKKSKEELSFMTLKSHTKFEEILNCSLEHDTRNLVKFHQNT